MIKDINCWSFIKCTRYVAIILLLVLCKVSFAQSCDNNFFYRIVFQVSDIKYVPNDPLEKNRLDIKSNLKIFNRISSSNRVLIGNIYPSNNTNYLAHFTDNTTPYCFNGQNEYVGDGNTGLNAAYKPFFSLNNSIIDPKNIEFEVEFTGKIDNSNTGCYQHIPYGASSQKDDKIEITTDAETNPDIKTLLHFEHANQSIISQTASPSYLQYVADCDKYQFLNHPSSADPDFLIAKDMPRGTLYISFRIIYNCTALHIAKFNYATYQMSSPLVRQQWPMYRYGSAGIYDDFNTNYSNIGCGSVEEQISGSEYWANDANPRDNNDQIDNRQFLTDPLPEGLKGIDLKGRMGKDQSAYLGTIPDPSDPTKTVEQFSYNTSDNQTYEYYMQCYYRRNRGAWTLYKSKPDMSHTVFKVTSDYVSSPDNINGATLYEYKIVNTVTYPDNCKQKLYSYTTLQTLVYPPISATVDVHDACANSLNNPGKGSISVSAAGGKPSTNYKYTLSGVDLSAYYRNFNGLTTEQQSDYVALILWAYYYSYDGVITDQELLEYNALYNSSHLPSIIPTLNKTIIQYASSPNTTVNYNDIGYGIYTLRVEDANNPSQCAYSENIYLGISNGPKLSTNYKSIVCKPDNIDLDIVATSDKPITSWIWGTNNPVLTTPATLSNSMNTSDIGYVCNIPIIGIDENGCTGSVTVEVPDFTPPPYVPILAENVLQTGAVKFKSAWLDDFTHMSFDNKQAYDALIAKNVYVNGQLGVYRTLSTFDYLQSRKQNYNTPAFDPRLKVDGTINDYYLFNWSHPLFETRQPEWVKNGEALRYNSNNQEIENRDILNTYSAALFGFKGTVPVAVASNAKNDEIVFENFEEYSDNPVVTEINNAPCNFDIVKKIDEITYKHYTPYKIIAGSGRYIVTDIPADAGVTNAMLQHLIIIAEAAAYTEGTHSYPTEETILYTKGTILTEVCDDDNHLAIQLGETQPELEQGIPGFFEGSCNRFWTGDLNIVEDIPIADQSAFNIEMTTERAHTGKRSVKIGAHTNSGSTIMKQYALNLSSKNEYILSGWITTDIHDQGSPVSLQQFCADKSIGIQVCFEGITNNSLGCTGIIQAEGAIINGWQKFEHKFSVPSGTKSVFLKFTNTYPYFLDDIRLFPSNSNIQTYVYDPSTLRQDAILDQNNYGTIYKYDDEGKLFSVQKETVEGIKTIQVTQGYLKPN